MSNGNENQIADKVSKVPRTRTETEKVSDIQKKSRSSRVDNLVNLVVRY